MRTAKTKKRRVQDLRKGEWLGQEEVVRIGKSLPNTIKRRGCPDSMSELGS